MTEPYQILQGDALLVLPGLKGGTAQTCVTSPPYWGLRDYGTATWEGGDAKCDHSPEKRGGRFASPVSGKQASNTGSGTMSFRNCPCGAQRIDSQIGLEATPEEYAAKMVEVFREVRRVLRDDGTLWLNLGDSYANTGKSGGGQQGKSWESHGGRTTDCKGTFKYAPPGLKPKDLVGIPWTVALALRADGWYLRSDIIWHKPNPMPESVTDRPTKAHEYLFLMSKSERYYYDAAAIKEPATNRAAGNKLHKYTDAYKVGHEHGQEHHRTSSSLGTLKGYKTRNRRTVWTIAPKPFKGAHFAVMPEALVEPCILAGSKPGDIVLDPFAGSGTTGLVAMRHGRRFLGVELNQEYVTMAKQRIAGPIFEKGESA